MTVLRCVQSCDGTRSATQATSEGPVAGRAHESLIQLETAGLLARPRGTQAWEEDCSAGR